MASGAPDDRALAVHADEVVAPARGRVLLLGAGGSGGAELPPTVTEVVRLPDCDGDRAALTGCFDTMVSVGAMAATDDLAGLLDALVPHLHRDGVLLFCDPTVVSDGIRARGPHDITGTLWAGAWSVIECHRFRAGSGPRPKSYARGRARLTRFVGPRRY